jgi:hypothetical protein
MTKTRMIVFCALVAFAATLVWAPWQVAIQSTDFFTKSTVTGYGYRYEPVWSGPEIGNVSLRYGVLCIWWLGIVVVSVGARVLIKERRKPPTS